MTDEEIIREARDRLTSGLDWEGGARRRAQDDYRFVNGDSDNGYQWPQGLRKTRETEQRPALTINKARQHCLQIVNNARQNQVEVRIDPVGDGATYESAQCMQDLVRHIEYQSQSQDVYINAVEHQVFTGIGYWRVLTDYVDSDSFDQEIYLRRIKDPGMVLLDPDIQELDGSDARYGFIYEDVPDDLFAKRYPRWKDKRSSRSTLGIGQDKSVPKDHTRVCEYYRRIEKEDRLYDTGTNTVKRSQIGRQLAAQLDADPSVPKRDVLNESIEWYLIIGDEIADRRDWPGRYVPIVRVIGEETVIDGKLDRKGHVRALKDPQRMYNYWSSSAVEFGALQSKVPWIIPNESVEGNEQYWKTANTVNHAYLGYKAISDMGIALPAPQRAQPPQAAEAFLVGMQTAANELMLASGQYQNELGQSGNEITGVAINARQRQSENSTYHYVANLASAIRYTGRILIDLIPRVYDTERVIQIMQENGDQTQISINPQMQQSVALPPQAQQQAEQSLQKVQRIFNPRVGRYSVQSNIGPAFATRRQEAFSALIQLVQANPAAMQNALDIVMRAADFPMADELAERLKPPAQSPQVQNLTQQLGQAQQIIAQMQQQLERQRARHTAVEQDKLIDAYRAETQRMGVLGNVDPMALAPVIQQMVRDAVATHLQIVLPAARTALTQPLQQGIPGMGGAMPPVPGMPVGGGQVGMSAPPQTPPGAIPGQTP